MRTISIEDAREQFETIVDAAEAGEEVVLTRAGLAVLRLVPSATADHRRADERSRVRSILAQARAASDERSRRPGYQPITAAELAEWAREGRR